MCPQFGPSIGRQRPSDHEYSMYQGVAPDHAKGRSETKAPGRGSARCDFRTPDTTSCGWKRRRRCWRGSGSRPVSRVLSWAVIHLRRASPHACSDLPGSGAGHASSPAGDALPYLVLLRVGFTLPPVLPPARCALTAPFHPYLASSRTYTAHPARAVAAPMRRLEAVYFLWHFPWARAPQALPGTLPFGARTFLRPGSRRRLPGRLPPGTV